MLAGKLDLGGPGIRAMGVFWLLTALAFWVAAGGALMNQRWWAAAAVAVALFSLTLSIIALPDSRIGVAVNLVILVALQVGQRLGS